MTTPAWGANPYASKHDWVRSVTGYTGQFGNNRFAHWGSQRGLDAATLTNVWDHMQQHWPQRYFQPPQLPPQDWGMPGWGMPGGLLGGWGRMPALQGLLGGHRQPLPAGWPWSSGPGQSWPVPASYAPSDLPAGAGHTMLWTY